MSDDAPARQDERTSDSDPKEPERGTSPWEWVAAALSAVLVIATVGTLAYDAVGEPSGPPLVEVRVERTVATGSGYLVEFRATNRGYSTAAGVVVEGELRGDSGSVERSQATLDYVPAEGSRQGGLFFSRDPARYLLEVRPLGYTRP